VGTRHRRLVLITWIVLVVGLGVFAPKLEHALSGAMWEVKGSDSLAAREVIDEQFGGLSSQSAAIVIHSDSLTVDSPEFQQADRRRHAILATESAVRPSDAGAAGHGRPHRDDPGRRAGRPHRGRARRGTHPRRGRRALHHDDGGDLTVALTGSPAFWSDFNAVNREGMMKAEILTWPVTAVILVLAFGTLAAAGLPLVLTAAGLVSSMGVLYGITRFTDLSIWTLNFAMMFALALGIDYALFIVTRYRAALHATPDDPKHAVGVAMDTAGKAVLFSGITVLISLSAVLLVPIPAFQSMAAGMMLSVSLRPARRTHAAARTARPRHRQVRPAVAQRRRPPQPASLAFAERSTATVWSPRSAPSSCSRPRDAAARPRDRHAEHHHAARRTSRPVRATTSSPPRSAPVAPARSR
jgi:RND superfamily putative drug exporter